MLNAILHRNFILSAGVILGKLSVGREAEKETREKLFILVSIGQLKMVQLTSFKFNGVFETALLENEKLTC